ncbi:acyl-CoA dehydrogenase family protein [Tepidicaulis sp.]|uniref:acyl-CoA dehydrogenase family protein n=1 Tax=Tepidicaulis sp. TaxID=1920809 RepID=UPI003B591C63
MFTALEDLPSRNQPAPLSGYNAYASHKALREAISREAPGADDTRLHELGATVGSAEVQELVKRAHENPPRLLARDAAGARLDEVIFHPAWHDWMRICIGSGAHSLGWTDERKGSDVIRAALFLLLNEADQAIACPLGMTHCCIPALETDKEIAARWRPRITSTAYDPRSLPAGEKTGLLITMAVTEQIAGTDLKQIETQALPDPATGGYLLSGRKWFYSVPQADGALVLARTKSGISCFLMPRFRPDGTRNSIYLHRLKDKAGDRANASSEAELKNAWAQRLGAEGRGFEVMFKMIQNTRFDVALSSLGLMHQAVAQALHYAGGRMAFGAPLKDLPLMENVLADLSLESEAALVLAMRTARAIDDAKHGDKQAARFARIAVALHKYWTCKRTPWAAFEAMEVFGGNGYIEDRPMARLYRQAPLNSIWEGSGNVLCLDVLRAIRQDGEAYAAVLGEIALAKSHCALLDDILRELETYRRAPPEEAAARQFTEKLTLALQASLLIRFAPAFVADALCASRLAASYRGAFGTLPHGCRNGEIVARAAPT